MRFLALLRIDHTVLVEAGLLGRPTDDEIDVHPQCILPRSHLMLTTGGHDTLGLDAKIATMK
jgi:hypothetical protein